jgi:hypothetical protein
MKIEPRRLQLTRGKLLALIDLYWRQTGRTPTQRSGPVQPGWKLTWKAVETSLRQGYHGLPGGESLAQLLAEYRGIRNRGRLARLTIEQILLWAEAYYRRTGRWPTIRSGPVPEAPGETWSGLDAALKKGCRGLPGGMSLAKVIRLYRNVLLNANWQTPPSDSYRSRETPAQATERILLQDWQERAAWKALGEKAGRTGYNWFRVRPRPTFAQRAQTKLRAPTSKRRTTGR